ncbi:MAG: SIMPL domain-containing protein [Nostocoides sp.]
MGSHVDVTGTGSASAAPDVVTLDVRVTCDGADVASTLQAASGTMSAVQGAAREAGVVPADLQTTGSGVHQRWANDRPEVVGYTAFHTLRLRVRDLDATGRLVTALSQVAGNSLGIDNISLTISDPEPLARLARERAFADALAKADQYASLAGRTLGPVVWVSDLPGGRSVAGAPGHTMMASREMASGMPVEAGENTVTASVAVRFTHAKARRHISDGDQRT